MRGNGKNHAKKAIWIAAALVVWIGIAYPLFVIYTVRTSGRKFLQVINTQDLQKYDRYFSPGTIFIVNGEGVPYSSIREKLYTKHFEIKEKSFYSPTDVPFDTAYIEYFKGQEFTVGLHGGIAYQDRGKIRKTSMDGTLVLRRQGLFFKVEEVLLNDLLD